MYLKKPKSIRQLQTYTGMSFGGIHRIIVFMKKNGWIHIAGWARRDGNKGGGWPVRLFLAGPGEDAPRIFKRTHRENNKRAWAKLKRSESWNKQGFILETK